MKKKEFYVLMLCLLAGPLFCRDTLLYDTFEILGEWVPASGRWQIEDGVLVQQDARNTITHIHRIVKQSGTMEYAFDLYYRGGFEDRYGGFGMHICIDRPTSVRSWGHNRSYLLWLTCDQAAYGSLNLYAQLYKSTGPTHMDYWLMEREDEFPVPLEILDPLRLTEADKIHIRLRLDLATGRGRFFHPLDEEYYFPIDLGSALEEGMYISLRTNSLSVGIDNFSVVRISD